MEYRRNKGFQRAVALFEREENHAYRWGGAAFSCNLGSHHTAAKIGGIDILAFTPRGGIGRHSRVSDRVIDTGQDRSHLHPLLLRHPVSALHTLLFIPASVPIRPYFA